MEFCNFTGQKIQWKWTSQHLFWCHSFLYAQCLLKHKNIRVWIYLEWKNNNSFSDSMVSYLFLTISSFNHKCASYYFRYSIKPTCLRKYKAYKMWKCMQKVDLKNFIFDLRWNKNLLLIVAEPMISIPVNEMQQVPNSILKINVYQAC